jgi:hypothetical protein
MGHVGSCGARVLGGSTSARQRVVTVVSLRADVVVVAQSILDKGLLYRGADHTLVARVASTWYRSGIIVRVLVLWRVSTGISGH